MSGSLPGDGQDPFGDVDPELVVNTFKAMLPGVEAFSAQHFAHAAIGVVHGTWRNTDLENIHASDPTRNDYEMFRSNVVTTRQVLETLRLGSFTPLFELLTDPDRLFCGYTAAEFCGIAWESVRARADGHVSFLVAVETQWGFESALWFATGGGMYGSGWWGTTKWHSLVTSFAERHSSECPAEYVELLLNSPELLTRQLFDLDIRRIAYGE